MRLAEKTRLQLAGNGLENSEYLREFLVEKIHESSFTRNYSIAPSDEQDFQRIRDDLWDLQYFNRIDETDESCIEAILRGSHESDRHVVLSGSGEAGVSIIVQLSKALKSLKEDYDWNPRRTIKLIISLGSNDTCRHTLLANEYERVKVVSYIELDAVSISESGYFVTTGSDIVRSIIMQAAKEFRNPNGKDPTSTEACREIICSGFRPRLRLDVPNAVINFVSSENLPNDDNSTNSMKNDNRRAICAIIGTSVWRLSEMILFKWDPIEDNKLLIAVLQSFNSSENLGDTIANAVDEIEKNTRNIAVLNRKIDEMDTTLSLKVRMTNDLSIQVRRLLICNDENSWSRSDLLMLEKLMNESTSMINKYLRALTSCYRTANQLLQQDFS
ncbi:uncharacterized protein [Venturia canescens]|uniref:uncharacterized protein isoform X2 n=1 Tax=Venturia canescens TaxID=32260 RepID=UPI001C9C0866|nr:uncharacterized protein LOC122409340 isoform X2 [Venturia canescens]